MKKLIIIITIISSSTLFAFGKDITVGNSDKPTSTFRQQEVITITGIIMLKGDVWVIHGTEGKSGETKDYYPGNLSQDFRTDGQRVIVEATLDPIPENVRLAGIPITITKLTRI